MDPVQRIPVNQAVPFDDVDIAAADQPLQDAVTALAGDDAARLRAHLEPVGRLAGSAETREHWHLANQYPPVYRPVDRYGRRIDEIDFHPSWHWLMERGVGFGLTAAPWIDDDPLAHLKRASAYYTWGQSEQGHMCPITMTYAVVPALRAEPGIAAAWTPGLASTTYDFGLRPMQEKAGLLAGMGMTEKQGGSDLRVNSTIAKNTNVAGEYRLTGHKWFTSAAMNDVFLVLAQTDAGSTCFVVSRVLPDGTRNPLTIVRLKDKLGNKSNASSELEFEDTWAIRLGEEGRGIRTIIEMVSATRMDCILGSASIMRKAFAEAAWHARHRAAFGARLIDQPAMVNVLADLAIESEAAMLTGLRLAAAVDRPDDEHERAFRRIGLALGKYWVCKRTPMMVGEALECLGGNGYAEESGMPLLYREAPLNSIWEGSGNVNALDVLRALSREPGTLDAWRAEVGTVAGTDARLDAAVNEVLSALADPAEAESQARWLTSRMAAILQASLLIRYSTPAVADAFCASRLGGAWAGTFGTLPRGLDLAGIVDRAQPAVS